MLVGFCGDTKAGGDSQPNLAHPDETNSLRPNDILVNRLRSVQPDYLSLAHSEYP
jgi:hypothetical protein